MGIGPVPAVEKMLKATGISLGQIDVAEINEAFAAQFLAVQKVKRHIKKHSFHLVIDSYEFYAKKPISQYQ